MTAGEVVLAMMCVFIGAIAIYLGVRLVTAAYFRSKHDYELRKSNEQRKKQ